MRSAFSRTSSLVICILREVFTTKRRRSRNPIVLPRLCAESFMVRSSRRKIIPMAATARFSSYFASYIEDHGIYRTADADIHLRAFELGFSGDVRHRVRRVVCLP